MLVGLKDKKPQRNLVKKKQRLKKCKKIKLLKVKQRLRKVNQLRRKLLKRKL